MKTLSPLPAATLQEHESLEAFFLSVRQRTEDLCTPLYIEDYIPQPDIFVSPPKWHLGHTSWFFEELVLRRHKPGYEVFNSEFPYVFNSYYNSLGERVAREERGNLTRPTVAEVYAYRRQVTKALAEFLGSGAIKPEVADLVVLGLNHEQQHQELLITDLKYTLSKNPLHPVYEPGFSLVKQYNEDDSGWISIPEGVYEIGHDQDSFCYDNELARHKVYLPDFEISKTLVTNGDFMEFISDQGYQRPELWLDEGWSWVNEGQHRAPMYWHNLDGQWLHYTLSGLEPIDPEAILCHINLFEAAAFAEWKGMRLPTEFEWETAQEHFRWGNRWEWTNSAYLPYPGFDKVPGAVGEYNGKFMVNQMVLRGASTATAPGHSRPTYRNFFHPHYQWQCTGIRLAR